MTIFFQSYSWYVFALMKKFKYRRPHSANKYILKVNSGDHFVKMFFNSLDFQYWMNKSWTLKSWVVPLPPEKTVYICRHYFHTTWTLSSFCPVDVSKLSEESIKSCSDFLSSHSIWLSEDKAKETLFQKIMDGKKL